jgi:plasmid stabilization system protein ParE
MVKVIVTPSAIKDAREIFGHYEACSSQSFAKKLLKEFIAYARRLETMPEMGPKSLYSSVTIGTTVMYSCNADTSSFTSMKKKPARF